MALAGRIGTEGFWPVAVQLGLSIERDLSAQKADGLGSLDANGHPNTRPLFIECGLEREKGLAQAGGVCPNP